MTTLMQRLAAGLGMLVLLVLCGICRADGFIIIHEPPVAIRPVPGHFSFAPLEVTYHKVNVDIDDQVAVTSVDQEFYNPNNQRLEGTYMFPLPDGAHIDKFSMDINGTMTDAELLPADKAKAIYEEIVRKYKDPALLEYMGKDAFRMRIFPIEPNSRKRVQIKYTQLLKADSGVTEFVYPLNTEKFSAKPLNIASVKVTITSKDAIKNVYCPSHNVETKRDSADPDHKVVVGYEDKNIRPDTDFKLVVSKANKELGVDVLSYRNGTMSDDGTFLLLASPGFKIADGKVQAKDVAFVLDTSGSMAGPKMDQAKKALQFCLANLNADDRFEIVRFSTEADTLFGELKLASKETVAKATSYVEELKATGGTAIDEALAKALKLGSTRTESDKRPYVVIFLTDGQPTVGETGEDKIVANAGKEKQSTRVFCFGIGNDVNTHLLDRIAGDTRAASQYVGNNENIEIKVSNFYAKIKEPVLSNVEVTISGDKIKTSKVYPGVMPDLFKGEMLIVYGRYTGSGAGAVKITGKLNGEVKEFVTDINLTNNDISRPFIPRLWATRRVGWLLDEIRMHGESAELKDEVIKLARDHGIVTPYTAYLIMEDEGRRNVPVADRTFREMEASAPQSAMAKDAGEKLKAEGSAHGERSGGSAVARAQDVGDLKSATNDQQTINGRGMGKGGAFSADDFDGAALRPAPSQPGGPAYGYRQSQNFAQQARVVNGRAFYQNGTVWTDSSVQKQQNLRKQEVKFNSEEYFALLKKYPTAAQWLSLGNELDLVLDDTLYVIRDN